VADAARALGLNYEAVRKRIKRGTLPAYKEGERWYVLLDSVPDNVPDNAGTPVRDTHEKSVDTGHSFPITPAEVEHAIARTGQQYTADLRTMLGELRAVYEGQISAHQETIAELRRRAEVAEAALAAAGAAPTPPAPPSAMPTPGAAVDTPVVPGGVRGLWRRVRRLVGGEG